MRKTILLAFLFLSAAAFASPTYTRFTDRRYNRIYFGPQGYYLGVKVRSNPTSTMIPTDQGRKLRGDMWGMVFGYEHKHFESLYAAAKISWAWGRIKNSSTSNRFVHDGWVETRLGYNMIAYQGTRLLATPYTGFAFLYTGNSRSQGFPSLKFKYYKYAIPVGLLLDYVAYSFFHIGFDFTWIPDVDATVKIKDTSARWVLKNSTGNFHVELPFIFYMGPDNQGEIRLVPFWRKTKNGRTDIINAGGTTLIPGQTNIYWGGNIALAYRF